AWWLASPLAADDYPATLTLWTRTGEPEAEIRLASVDLPPALVAALVRSPETRRGSPRVERLDRTPGVHYVLLVPLDSGEVLTVGVGPRTWLIPAARVARFLGGELGVTPPYQIFLSLPSHGPPAATARVIWTRAGWSARGERRIEPPGGVRHVHLRVDLRDPWALAVRGALVVWMRTCGCIATGFSPARARRCWGSWGWSTRSSRPTCSCDSPFGTSSRSPMTGAPRGARSGSVISWCSPARHRFRAFSRLRSSSMTSGCASSRRTWRSY